MKRRMLLGGCGALVPVGCVTLGGCAATPTANVSDMAVFTSVHLLAAEASTDIEGASGDAQAVALGSGPFTAAHMHRYFESTTQEYKPERMDAMLDGQQRQTAFAQAVQQQAAFKIAANLSPVSSATGSTPTATSMKTSTSSQNTSSGSTSNTSGGSNNSGGSNSSSQSVATTQPVDFVSSQVAAMNALLQQQFATPVVDSPFDQLDRVADFYAAYVVKNLRVRGDSRVINPDVLAKLLIDAMPKAQQPLFRCLLETAIRDRRARRAAPDQLCPSDRLLLLVFQAHVDPGTAADQMVGVRLHIVRADDKYKPQVIKLIRLHPTRAYDVDSGSFSQSAQSALSLSGSFSGTIPGKAELQGSGSSDASQENSERQRYLSHINKISSFADAGLQTFGYNFYPSNIEVERLNPIAAFFACKTFAAHGYVEAGAHDCAAIVVVPRDLREFTCRVSHVSGSVEGGQVQASYLDKSGVTQDLKGVVPPDGAEEFTVTLPPWTAIEQLGATVGAAPLQFQGPTTKPASTQPADYTVSDDRTVTQVKTDSCPTTRTCTSTTRTIITVHHLAVEGSNATDPGSPAGTEKGCAAPAKALPVTMPTDPGLSDYLNIGTGR